MRRLLVLLAACNSPQSSVGNTAAPRTDAILIALDRTVCLGWCPEYSLTITGTGRVEYIGMDSVKKKGSITTTIPAAKLDALVRMFEEAKFTTFPSNMEGNITDVPSLHLSYGGKTVTYSSAVVVPGSPDDARREAVKNLADAVDRAVSVVQWTGTNAEREKMFEEETERRTREGCRHLATAQARQQCLIDNGLKP